MYLTKIYYRSIDCEKFDAEYNIGALEFTEVICCTCPGLVKCMTFIDEILEILRFLVQYFISARSKMMWFSWILSRISRFKSRTLWFRKT